MTMMINIYIYDSLSALKKKGATNPGAKNHA